MNNQWDKVNKLLPAFMKNAENAGKAVDEATATLAKELELIVLRRRVKAQRAELRRLNKYLGPYFAGFRRGCEISEMSTLRCKMAKVFGWAAVQAAEKE